MIFDTKEEMPKFTVSADEEARKEEVIWSQKENTMREAIGELQPGKVTYFVTNGAWSLYELLHYLVRQTGPADMHGFTWNLSMTAVNTIIRLREAGYIKSVRMLINTIMRRFMIEPVAVLQRNAERVVLYPNHAKGFLLKNDKWTVSVICSANFSNNPQIEGGSISCNPAVYEMHRRWLDPLLEKKELLAANRIEPKDLPPEEAPDERPRLFLIRGLPGSGKSTLAHAIADRVFEFDDFLDGSYDYKYKELQYAKATTLGNCRIAMEEGVKRIAIANVFCNEDDLQDYQNLAAKYGYLCHIFTLENRQKTKCVREIKAETIANMRKKFKVRL